MFLVFYRQVDKPGGSDSGVLKTTVGVSWGIFVAFLFGALLAYAGLAHPRAPPPRAAARRRRPAHPDASRATRRRSRAARRSRRSRRLPDERPTQAIPPDERPTRVVRRGGGPGGTRRGDGQFEGQLSFDDPDNQERLT